MQLICTKKVFDAMKREPEKFVIEYDPFFVWTVDLVTINRRKALLVMNNGTLYSFLLYGIKKQQLQELERTVLNGIRAMLEADQVTAAVIEQYMERLPAETCYRKAFDRSNTARLSKVKLGLDFLYMDVIPDKYLQVNVSQLLNDEFRGMGEKSVIPQDEMVKMLTELSGQDIYSITGIELLVSVDGPGYIAWRRLVLPDHFNLWQLKMIIGVVFDIWLTAQFRFISADVEKDKVYYICEEEVSFPDDIDTEVYWAEDYKLSEVALRHQKMFYEPTDYTTTIKFIRHIENYNKPYAECLAGGGVVPETEKEDETRLDQEFIKVMQKVLDVSEEEAIQALEKYNDSKLPHNREFYIELVNMNLKDLR
ncbi:DUF6933 domain-containing protein [Phascolarctobacterium sp.]